VLSNGGLNTRGSIGVLAGVAWDWIEQVALAHCIADSLFTASGDVRLFAVTIGVNWVLMVALKQS